MYCNNHQSSTEQTGFVRCFFILLSLSLSAILYQYALLRSHYSQGGNHTMITVSDLGINFSGQDLFKHVDLKFVPGNCYGVQHGLVVVGEVILLEHRHTGALVDDDLAAGGL